VAAAGRLSSRRMPVESVRIHEATWAKSPKARRLEWRALLADLPLPDLWPGRSVESMVVACDSDALLLDLSTGGESQQIRVARGDFDLILSEYLGVIARLEEDGIPMARAEALDMAKRVVHDDAARRLGALIPELGTTHDARRKFFSLVVSLAVDTSKMGAAHRHR